MLFVSINLRIFFRFSEEKYYLRLNLLLIDKDIVIAVI